MLVTIHQPQYLPYLGYFHKMAQADVFVLLDNVQYKKNEWQNRNKIRTSQGWQWLTVPVSFKFGDNIDKVRINKSAPWNQEHYKGLALNYQRAPYFKEHEPFLKEVYSRSWESLAELNIYFIKYLARSLEITTRLVRASELSAGGKSTERLINICRELGADTYLSGVGGKEYLDLGKFEHAKIKVKFQNFVHPNYKQVYNGFEAHMSALDLILNQGEKSSAILKGGGE